MSNRPGPYTELVNPRVDSREIQSRQMVSEVDLDVLASAPMLSRETYSQHLHREMAAASLGDLLDRAAKSQCLPKGAKRTESQLNDQLYQVMTADAWDECFFKLTPFVLTYFYELFPSLVVQFVCWLIEGRDSARNRKLLYPEGMVHDIMLRTHWVCLYIFFAYSPPGVTSLDMIVTFLLLSFRGMCIAMKYAYMPTSDLRQIQASSQWNKADLLFRSLGAATHFNLSGTYYFDVMREILVSALRANVLQELSKHKFQTSPEVATKVWNDVKANISKIDNIDAIKNQAILTTLKSPVDMRGSKFGDVQKLVELSDTQTIDDEASIGELRPSVVAYYFATESYRPAQKTFLLVFITNVLLCAPVALARYFVQDHSEATTATKVLLCLRMYAYFTSSFLLTAYLFFCFLDAWKRNILGNSVLSSIGHKQVRGGRLLAGYADFSLPLDTIQDMLAFWVVQRVLGPELYRGQGIRYNCAYLCVSVAHLIAMCAVLAFWECEVDDIGAEWASAIEIIMPFVSTLVMVVLATLIAEKANRANDLPQKVIKRKALDHELRRSEKNVRGSTHSESAQSTEEFAGVVELLNDNFDEVLPVQIFYQAATTEVLSMVYAGMTLLSDIMRRQLQAKLFPNT